MRRLLKYFGLVFYAFFVFASRSQADDWQLSCTAIDTQNRYLSASNGTETYFLTEFRFSGSPFVESRLSCAQWVEFVYMQNPIPRIKNDDLKTLMSSEAKNAARLLGSARKQLYKLCNEHPFCEIRFPYNIHLGWQAFFGASAKSGFSQPDVCFEKTVTHPKIIFSDSSAARLAAQQGEVRAWTSPPQSYGLEVEKILNFTRNELVVVTALGASLDELQRLKESLPQGKKLLVLLDFYIFLTEERLAEFFKLPSTQFYILPMFNTPQYRRAYHIKAAAGFAFGSPAVLTSSNIKDQGRMETFDFGLTFTAGALGQELADFLIRDAIEACMQLPYAHCTLEQRYANEHPYRKNLEEMFFKSCQMLKNSQEVQRSVAREPKQTFLSTVFYDLEDLITKMIAETKKNIVIVSDQVGHEAILEKLNDTGKKGVSVDIFMGREPIVDPSSYPFIRFHRTFDAARKNHAKGMLFDGERLIVGSGNLTKTGLSQAREIFMMTEDREIVRGFVQYLQTLKQAFSLGLK